MASIKTRVACLEQASKVTVLRQLTDAERVVRVVHVLKNPELHLAHASIVKLLRRAGAPNGYGAIR